jgi:uncharacterized protein (TIGR03118 family)
MRNTLSLSSRLFSAPFIFLFSVLLFSIGCKKNLSENQLSELNTDLNTNGLGKPPQLLKDFVQVNLVANNANYGAALIDPTLVNPWGLAVTPTGIFWPASQGTGLSQVYNSQGVTVRPPVIIPGPFSASGGNPTGVVFNSSADFRLPNGLPARFIFAGLDGVISGWNSGNAAIRMVNQVGISVYTGLAIGNDAGNNFLYAADFKAGEIDVFDKNYVQVAKPFIDPSLPEGYSPFNIQNIEGKLYVMYAKVGADGRDEAGPGNGYVSIFSTSGAFEKRFLSRGQLNAPWGIAKVGAGFFGDDNIGKHAVAAAILVGNFGDGRINAYTLDGESLGQLRAHGNPIIIDGLWALTAVPATAAAVDKNRVYFTAGPNDEMDGIFGYLRKE